MGTRFGWIFPLSAALLLAGCGGNGAPASATHPSGASAAPAPEPAAQAPPGRPAPIFSDDAIGLSLDPVAGMTLYRHFHRDYAAGESWKAFAPADSRGRALAALVLDGSNDITAAEMRIGVSDNMLDVAQCLQPPAGISGDPDQVEIGNVAFVHFTAGDAAMSHYMQVDGYRSVRNGRCVAIDLMVSGTRPEVYDPPRAVPFQPQQARERLHAALSAVHWTR
ncbi:hypothetical protein [Stenotrophomonas sp. MMGLT7]|uniref:hypothetical protein n=1 Tax=Stenotrophomonas sp. MMGLT7 TaxID=2901227 RepID=UPI001E31A6BC|nr:hypothetical protein [Stenotrophomonas sp. MMGLT7]MCD7098083.1 hypothetical protein [Stenotrophomonas sp. MMGLT7]